MKGHTKRCPRCGMTKARYVFARNGRGQEGNCLDCHRAISRASARRTYAANRERYCAMKRAKYHADAAWRRAVLARQAAYKARIRMDEAA